jgi:hypothetical protein
MDCATDRFRLENFGQKNRKCTWKILRHCEVGGGEAPGISRADTKPAVYHHGCQQVTMTAVKVSLQDRCVPSYKVIVF